MGRCKPHKVVKSLKPHKVRSTALRIDIPAESSLSTLFLHIDVPVSYFASYLVVFAIEGSKAENLEYEAGISTTLRGHKNFFNSAFLGTQQNKSTATFLR